MADELKYLLNPKNGNVVHSTPYLEQRGGMIPCDEKGNPIIAKPAKKKRAKAAPKTEAKVEEPNPAKAEEPKSEKKQG